MALPTSTVAIVESEKSAIIASIIMPELIWLAAGGIQGLSIEKCKVLKGRNVILYPDFGAYEKWTEKAKILNSLSPTNSQEIHFLSPHGESTRRGIEVREGFNVRYSTVLKNSSTPVAKANGLNIADYLINQLR